MSFLPLLGWCALTAMSADTISVNTARCTPAMEFHAPYQTDSLNLQGKPFDIQSVMKENALLIVKGNDFKSQIVKGTMLSAGSKKNVCTMQAFRFALNADRFMKVSVSVPHMSNKRTYVNGEEKSLGDLQLTPGRTEITIVNMAKPESRDSFVVNVTGKSLEGLTVGEDQKKLYTVKLMNEGEHYSQVSLSPSGQYLLTGYYYMKPDGSAVYRSVLTDLNAGKDILRSSAFLRYSWLHHSDILYFTRETPKGIEMVKFHPKTLTEEVVATNLPAGGFTLSPKEDYAIFSRTIEGRNELVPGLKRIEEPDDRMGGWRNRNALYRYDFKTHQMQPLTFGQTSVWLNDISSDGQRLLMSFDRFDATKRPFNRQTVVEMDAYTGKVDTISCDATFLNGLKYSPNGKQLLISASPQAFDNIGNEVPKGMIPNGFDYRLYRYTFATQKVEPILKNFKPSVNSFTWSYGDGNIYFKADDGYDISYFRLNPKTLKVTRFKLPVTCLGGISIAEAQSTPRAVFFGQTGTRARDMYLCTLSSEQPKTKQIGDISFDKLFGDVALGEVNDWDFKSSRGDTIKGFYVLPVNFDKTKKYPMIVYYYGGCTPTTKQLEFLPYPFQVFAGQGYVVYVVEPSGAIGFGQEFAARHVNTWGQGSADDIIEGTKKFVEEHSFVDGKKIGCIGASYGGFMTQYLQTRTDIFAAAISHAGISNIASYWGGGNWGYSYGQTAQYGSFPWNNPDLYTKQSSLFNADKIHTPLLLLHGTADTNVPTNESQQLFTALRILGRPVSYVQVDGENHYIANYAKRQAWQNTIFAWFAYWLKGQKLWWETLYPGDDFGIKNKK